MQKPTLADARAKRLARALDRRIMQELAYIIIGMLVVGSVASAVLTLLA